MDGDTHDVVPQSAHSLTGLCSTRDIEEHIRISNMLYPKENGFLQEIHNMCTAVLMILNVAAAAMTVRTQYENESQ